MRRYVLKIITALSQEVLTDDGALKFLVDRFSVGFPLISKSQ